MMIIFQRELSLQESEFKRLFDEKEEESRLAREEHELRLNSLSAAEGSKAQLMQDLEAKIVAANAAKQGRDSRILGLICQFIDKMTTSSINT